MLTRFDNGHGIRQWWLDLRAWRLGVRVHSFVMHPYAGDSYLDLQIFDWRNGINHTVKRWVLWDRPALWRTAN